MSANDDIGSYYVFRRAIRFDWHNKITVGHSLRGVVRVHVFVVMDFWEGV